MPTYTFPADCNECCPCLSCLGGCNCAVPCFTVTFFGWTANAHHFEAVNGTWPFNNPVAIGCDWHNPAVGIPFVYQEVITIICTTAFGMPFGWWIYGDAGTFQQFLGIDTLCCPPAGTWAVSGNAGSDAAGSSGFITIAPGC